MKLFLPFLLLPLPLLASPPKKPLPSRYMTLQTNSPFTTPAPPPVTAAGPVVNPLDDWTLGGVTKFPDGYFVILINKKKPDEKTVIQPGMHSEFEVLEVVESGIDYKETTVKLRYGSTQGTVSFDAKTLTVNSPSQSNPEGGGGEGRGKPQQGPGFPPGLQPPAGAPQPRLRTIAPPANPQTPQPNPRR